MSDSMQFPVSPAPWEMQSSTTVDVQDVKQPGEVPAEPPEESEELHGLSYKLGLIEGAVEVAILKLEQSDEEAIADGLKEVLKRVRDREPN